MQDKILHKFCARNLTMAANIFYKCLIKRFRYKNN